MVLIGCWVPVLQGERQVGLDLILENGAGPSTAGCELRVQKWQGSLGSVMMSQGIWPGLSYTARGSWKSGQPMQCLLPLGMSSSLPRETSKVGLLAGVWVGGGREGFTLLSSQWCVVPGS